MGVVHLTITKPSNGQVFTGAAAVPLAGRVDSTPAGSLFFAWYSSLYVAPDPVTDAALHRPANPQTEVTKPLEIGTHVLTFTAKDVAGENQAAIEAVTEAGLAGGPPDTPLPCLVTVLTATLLQPTAPGTNLSKAGAVLAAKAPVNWAQPDYQANNRVGYTFTFTSGSTTVPFTPAPNSLVFEGNPAPPKVRYTGPLPGSLPVGAYQLRARVFDLQNTAVGHESAPLAVNVTA
ncbi:hypothetical protein [Flindersiella endophytica]